jgi:hypothetical protein
MERGCSKLEGTLTDQLQLVVTCLRVMEIRCVRCQVRQAGSCRHSHLGWCTHCKQEREECDVCSVPITLTATSGVAGAKSYAQRLQAKGMKSAEMVSVNMHKLGESFVEKVSDVRTRATVDGRAAAPGESLEFLAHVRGWQSEARRQRRDKLVRIPGSRPGIMWTCIVRVTGIMSTMIPGEGIQHACGQFEHAIDSVNLARVKRKEKKRGEAWFPFNFV